MNPRPYLSASATEIRDREQARRAANARYVRVFPSYREAELHGYHSLKRLRRAGLEVRESERPNYSCDRRQTGGPVIRAFVMMA